jgi:hypothetical protein
VISLSPFIKAHLFTGRPTHPFRALLVRPTPGFIDSADEADNQRRKEDILQMPRGMTFGL